MLTPDQYYDKALAAQGLTPKRELEKIAAARGVDIETAKLAQLFWNKLAEDKITYGSSAGQAEDSLNLAKHYAAYVNQHKIAAAAKADALAAGLKKAAVQLMDELKIAGMSPEDALAAGSAQASAAQDHNAAIPPQLSRSALIGGDGALHPGVSDALTAAGSPPPADIPPEALKELVMSILAQHPEWAERDMAAQPGPGAAPLLGQETLA